MLPAFTVMTMKAGTQWLGLVAVVAAAGLWQACQFPTPSKDYVCESDTDCDPERVCSPTKFCVLRSTTEPDAAVTDAGSIDSPPIDADPFAATRAACIAAGYTLEPTTGNYYRIATANANWNNAYTDCNNDVDGATHLITLSTTVEIAFQANYNDYWVGWIDRPMENQWHLLTDEVTTINQQDYWGNNRPDGGNSENCAVWRNNVDGKAGYDDIDCPDGKRYICECDGRPVTKPPT
jgi:hypothetical protein